MVQTNEQTSIAREMRLQNVAKDYVDRGITNHSELGRRHGCSAGTIKRDLEEIRKRLRAGSHLELHEHQTVAMLRMENTFQLATAGYERSREDETTTTTEHRQVPCTDCKGTGWKDSQVEDGEWCPVCDGDGHKIVEITRTKTRGKAGDPAFLRVRNESVREMMRILGLDTNAKTPQHVIVQQNNIDVAGIPTDTVLDAMKALQQLQDRSNMKTNDIVIPAEEPTVSNEEEAEGGSVG